MFLCSLQQVEEKDEGEKKEKMYVPVSDGGFSVSGLGFGV